MGDAEDLGDDTPMSIGEKRRRGMLLSNTDIMYKEVPSGDPVEGPESDGTGSVENEQDPWQVEAMEFFKSRLEDIEVEFQHALSDMRIEQSRTNVILTGIKSVLVSLLEDVTERSEVASAQTTKLNITLEDIPVELVESIEQEVMRRVDLIKASHNRLHNW